MAKGEITGSIYKHKLSGQRMTILRRGTNVAVCELIDEPEEWVKRLQVSRKRRAVCYIKFLEIINNQYETIH